MKKMIPYLRPHMFKMAFGLLIKILGTFADLGLPYILAHIINNIIPLNNAGLVLVWGGIMLILALLARTFNIIANRMASKTARDSVECIRYDLFNKVLHLSGSQTDQVSVPSLITRLTSDTYNVHQTIGMMQRLGVRAPMILFGGVVISFILEPVLSLILIAVIPLLAVVVMYISRKGIPLYSKVQKCADRMVRTIREDITGIRVIKALSKTEYEKKRFNKVNQEMSKLETDAGETMALTGPMMNFLLNAGIAAVIVVGAYRVNAGAAAHGTIVAFLTYFTMILYAVLMINRIFISFSKASASAMRIAEVLELEKELLCEEPKYYEGSEFIVFDNVSFSYHSKRTVQDEEKNIKTCLEHISFKIKKGGSLGIIGATGSGKTALINLLMRFYDVDEGIIYIDGKSIKSYELNELRRMFGTVFQNDMIFLDTIYENINFGRDLSMDEVRNAAYNGQAEEFIDEKPGAYQYKASIKGADFSGGQKQRLLISRSMAKMPQILVFDDSSSALDYKTDAKLRNAIKENYSQSVTIMSAQRISSIMNMDTILVLEEGQMIGLGSHDELMDNCMVYKEIYHSQMGYAAM